MSDNCKDEIAQQIVKLEKAVEDSVIELDEKTKIIESKTELVKSLKVVWEDIRVKLSAANTELDLSTDAARSIKYKAEEDKRQIELLKRELSRILSAEEINKAYVQQVEAFREKCLDATWRAENREDGFGAFAYQIDGAIMAAVPGQALLGDKRGLGKSLTSIIWMDLRESHRVIALCPSDTMDNFIREVKMWTPHRSVIKLGKMPKAERDIVLNALMNIPEYTLVLNYEAWRFDSELIPDLIALKADTLIEDEAHRGKNIESHTGKGIQKIRFGLNVCPNCENPDITPVGINEAYCVSCEHRDFVTEFCSIKSVLPMTGTPILNRPQELFPILRQIDPKNFTSEYNFLRDFCKKLDSQRWTWQVGAEKELISKIGPRYIARDRKSAGVIIPPSKPILHLIPFKEMEDTHPAQAKAYKQVRDYAQLVLDPDLEITHSMVNKLEVFMRLRQVLVWPNGINLEVKSHVEPYEVIFSAGLNVYESIKIDKAEELISEIIDEGDRVVLFSQFRGGLHELKSRIGSRAVVYDGSASSTLRDQIQLDFDPKTAPDIPRWSVVLCNYKSAGEGLNLNAATHLIKLDRQWNPGSEDQAHGRIDRIGTTEETTIHTIAVENSIDSWMERLIEEKRDLIAGFQSEVDVFRAAWDALGRGEL